MVAGAEVTRFDIALVSAEAFFAVLISLHLMRPRSDQLSRSRIAAMSLRPRSRENFFWQSVGSGARRS
ncbi:MAG TPA: hypothetical protein DCP25_12475 [Chloroflexi bacterium]|nr:hypothetical protein [Chloroflexota bacterium]